MKEDLETMAKTGSIELGENPRHPRYSHEFKPDLSSNIGIN